MTSNVFADEFGRAPALCRSPGSPGGPDAQENRTGGRIRPSAECASQQNHPCLLTFGRQRLWFLDQLDLGNALYNVTVAVRLTGELQEQAPGRTFNAIVERLTALRSRFAAVDGVPAMAVVPRYRVALEVVVRRSYPPLEQQAKCQALVLQEMAAPLNLSRSQLTQTRLLRLQNTEHVLLLTLHRMVSQTWSMSVLIREVAALCTTQVQSRRSSLAQLEIQCVDNAPWQRPSAEKLHRQLADWPGQVVGGAAPLRLRTLAQQRQATLFKEQTAVLKVLWSRFAGQKDVCSGTPAANRQRGELELLIRSFVDTLVLLTRIDRSSSDVGGVLPLLEAGTLQEHHFIARRTGSKPLRAMRIESASLEAIQSGRKGIKAGAT